MSLDEDPPRGLAEPATKDVEELQLSEPSVTAAALDDRTESLDAVAGSEFVDDRIRRQE